LTTAQEYADAYRAGAVSLLTGDFRAIVPRWLYDLGVEKCGEDTMAQTFTPVDDWSDDATL